MSRRGWHHPVVVPTGYPREYERELRLHDGRTATVRPIIPADAAQLGQAIRRADPDTLRRRFLGSPPPITPRLLNHLCTVDYLHRFALVAADPRTARGIAIARYERLEAAVADVAVVVDPAWRRVGLATMMIEMLAAAALDRGVTTFSAYYLAENRPVAALLGLAGGSGTQVIRDGFAEVAVALNDREVPSDDRAVSDTQPEHSP